MFNVLNDTAEKLFVAVWFAEIVIGAAFDKARRQCATALTRHTNNAKIFFADGVWVLRDLGSANGTYVNRQRCNGLVELEAGDLVPPFRGGIAAALLGGRGRGL